MLFEGFSLAYMIAGGPFSVWRDLFGSVAHPRRTIATKAVEYRGGTKENGLFMGSPVEFFQKNTPIARQMKTEIYAYKG